MAHALDLAHGAKRGTAAGHDQEVAGALEPWSRSLTAQVEQTWGTAVDDGEGFSRHIVFFPTLLSNFAQTDCLREAQARMVECWPGLIGMV